MTIGMRLLTLRQLRRLTQAQAASLGGVSAASVGRWETGVTSPAADRLEVYLTALGASLAFEVDEAHQLAGQGYLCLGPPKASSGV